MSQKILLDTFSASLYHPVLQLVKTFTERMKGELCLMGWDEEKIPGRHPKITTDVYITMCNEQNRRVEDESTCKERVLVKDGVWIVGVEERPKGWEKYGVRESMEDSKSVT